MATAMTKNRVIVTEGIALETYKAGDVFEAVISGQQSRVHISNGAWLVSIEEKLWSEHGTNLYTLLKKMELLDDHNFAFMKLWPRINYDQWLDEATNSQKILYYIPREIADKLENAGKVLDLMFEGRVHGKPLSEVLRSYQRRAKTRELNRRETTNYIG